MAERVLAGADVRLPIFLAGVLGHYSFSIAWVLVMLWWALGLLAASRNRARRKARSAAYQLPLLGPKGIRKLIHEQLLRAASPLASLQQQTILHDTAMPTLGGVAALEPFPEAATDRGSHMVEARALPVVPGGDGRAAAGLVGCRHGF